jgi:hypothetical protein
MICLTFFYNLKVILETTAPQQEVSGEGGSAASIHDVLLAGEAQLKASIETVVRLAERYFDRFEAAALLGLLPPSTPIHTLLRFLKIVMEYNNTRKRNLKVN